MNIVLLSGGSGKRLWPLSNEVRSKQFLKLIKNADGENISMLQRTYGQLINTGITGEILIATSISQAEAIKHQLSENVSVVVEPERRNTFPAIALSAAYLSICKNCPPDDTVTVLPVDPYVDDIFFDLLHELDSAVQNNKADIILIGVKPSVPTEKYGYIVPAVPAAHETSAAPAAILKVAEFKEKPSTQQAQQLIDRGALWNCGVFAFRLRYLIDILTSQIDFTSYDDVLRQYGSLEKTSFDYAVVEKAASVSVIPYSGQWKDLGSWVTLTEVMEDTSIGNVVKSDDCAGTHVINELDIPVVVMGLTDAVVAASPDGILVTDKAQSSYLKQYVESFNNRPMYEERSWGEYNVLDISGGGDGPCTVTKRKKIRKGAGIEYGIHSGYMEVWTVLSGKCVITIGSTQYEALPGATYSIEANTGHSLKALTDVEIIETQVEK